MGPRRGQSQGHSPITEQSHRRGLLAWPAPDSPGGRERGREDARLGRQPWPRASCALGPAAGSGHLSGHGAALPTPRPQLFL